MAKIFWYRKPNGKLEDLPEKVAADLHYKITTPNMGFRYLGWSDGRFIQLISRDDKPKRDERGLIEQPTEGMKTKLQEAIDKELEFAREHPEGPRDFSKMEMSGDANALRVHVPKTPGISQL